MSTSPTLPAIADPLPIEATPFERVQGAYLRDLFAAHPVLAGMAGYHLVDDRWGDPSEAGRSARLAMLARHRAAFAALPDAALSASERTDRAMLLEQIDQLAFADEVLREEAWDPLGTVATAGGALFGLLAREYAPWSFRGAAFLGRLVGLPAYLERSAAALTGLPGRPVALLHLDTALRQLPGIGELIDEGVAEARRRAAAGEIGRAHV